MNLATVKISPDGRCLMVSGIIAFDTLVQLREQGGGLIHEVKPEEIIFDFQEVERSDSSALALLTAWAREARKLGKKVKFVNLQSQLMDIARLSNLDKIIQLSAL